MEKVVLDIMVFIIRDFVIIFLSMDIIDLSYMDFIVYFIGIRGFLGIKDMVVIRIVLYFFVYWGDVVLLCWKFVIWIVSVWCNYLVSIVLVEGEYFVFF